MSELNILLVDDHDIVRTGLILLLKKGYPFANFTEAANGEEALAAIKLQKFGLITMDINMPETDSFRIIESILALRPDTKILVLSQYPDNLYATRYLKAGCWGYINKNSSNGTILLAVNDIINNNRKYVSPEMIDQMVQGEFIGKPVSNPFDKLSNRELEVAKNLLLGKNLEDIRNLMNIQKTTFSTHKMRIFEKLKITNLMELKTLADEYNFK